MSTYEIETAGDWEIVEPRLLHLSLAVCSYEVRRDVFKLIKNIRREVNNLSRLELWHRRSPYASRTPIDEKVVEINKLITFLTEWMTLLVLKYA